MITFDVGTYENTLREMYRSMTVEEILADALKVIEQGWTKGELGNTRNEVCMLGALNKASNTLCSAFGGPSERNAEAYREAANILGRVAEAELTLRDVDTSALRQITGNFNATIPAFNDMESTTLEDVRLVFKRALGEAQEESTE